MKTTIKKIPLFLNLRQSFKNNLQTFQPASLNSGRRMIGISGSLIYSKTLMELIFSLTPEVNFGEVQRPQLAKSTLLELRWCSWDILRSFKICSDAKEREGERVWCGKQREATAPIQSLVKLQPWFLSLRWKTYLWAEQQPRFLRSQ